MGLIEQILSTALIALQHTERRPWILGICGAQGSGKSTLAQKIEYQLLSFEVKAVTISIDDLYLSRGERTDLATTTHPLLITRGVPGTHDVKLGLDTITAIASGCEVKMPRFDKLTGDRVPETQWPSAPIGTEIVILEGWCVGAIAQPDLSLIEPINDFERYRDASGAWRQFVNRALADEYQELFSYIDYLVLLAAPNFEIVRDWRIEQERGLIARTARGGRRVMSDQEVELFVAHYERLTRFILAEMPARADLTVNLDEGRNVIGIARRTTT